MGKVHNLYFDIWINAGNKLLEYFAEHMESWEELPDYRKLGKLEYFSQLPRYLAILESGARDGKLTDAQMRKYKELRLKAEVIQPFIDYLKNECYGKSKKIKRRIKIGRGGNGNRSWRPRGSGESAGKGN